jgi:hypothetical protein
MTVPSVAPERRAQRGAVLALAVLAVFAAATAMLAVSWGLADDASATGARAAASADQALLAAARERVLLWYAQHLGELDRAGAFPRAPADVLRGVDLGQSPALRFAAGPVNAGTAGYHWRPLALWLSPAADDRSGFDEGGRFSPDPRVRASVAFASEALQRQAYAASEQRLRVLATMAELRFVAKLRADPDHDLARNWFRASDCDQVGADDLPCTEPGAPQTMASLMATSDQLGPALRRAADLPPPQQPDALAVNAWGGPNLFDNAAGAAALPFSMRFSTTTPFATRIEVVAVQPVE